MEHLNNNYVPAISDLQRLIITHSTMLQAIRSNPRNNKDLLKDQCHISWPTSRNTINTLLGLDKEGKEAFSPLIYSDSDGYHVIPETGYFLGISIGTKKIRATLIDFAFHPLSADERIALKLPAPWDTTTCDKSASSCELTYDTPDTLSEIRSICQKMIVPLFELHKQQQTQAHPAFTLLGIGLVLPGTVEYQRAVVVSSPSKKELQNVTAPCLIGTTLFREAAEHGIFFSLDHNAKGSVVSEYEYLLTLYNPENRPRNIAVIYFGTGIGVGIITQGRLLRGSHNFSGELGHICFPSETHASCRCGQNNCLEAIINAEINEKTAQYQSDEAISAEAAEKKARFDVLLKFVPIILNLLTNIISFDMIILSGHDIRKLDGIVDALKDSSVECIQPHIGQACKLSSGRNLSSTAAIGAAIQAYYSMCACDLSSVSSEPPVKLEKLMLNNAYDLSWI